MTDEEMQSWARAWQATTPDLEPLRRRTQRERTCLRWLVIGDLLGSLACLVAAGWLAWDFSPFHAAMAGLFVVVGVGGLVFTAQNWRGVWHASGESAHDFLSLAVRRSAARIRWALLGIWLLAAEVVFFAGLFAWRWQTVTRPVRSVAAGLLAVALIGLVGAWLLRFLRRERARQVTLRQLAAQLDLED